LVPLDAKRDWGWHIVNYGHYRKIKDEEARRSYFRTEQRKYRAKKKKEVQVEEEEGVKGCQTLSNDVKLLSLTAAKKFEEWMIVRRGMGKKPKNWDKMFQEQIKWLSQYTESIQHEILSASIRNNWQGLFEPKSNGQKPITKQTTTGVYGKNRLPPQNDISEEELAEKRKQVAALSAKLRDELKK
jgi:hypothetical protein